MGARAHRPPRRRPSARLRHAGGLAGSQHSRHPARLREIEATGRRIGQELATAVAASPEQAIGDLLTALGFQPEIEHEPEGRLRCRLRNCPYRDSVRENQAVVCTLHRGLTRGLLDRLAPTATLERFAPHDPDRAGCEIDIDGLASAVS
jgi:predicted ArsR family transcriptional regulator